MKSYLIGTIQASLKEITDLSFSPRGTKIATASNDGQVKVFEISTGRLLRNFSSPEQQAYSLSWSPDGAVLAVGYQKNRIIIWDLRTGQQWKRLKLQGGKKGAVFSLNFSNDNKLLAAGGKCNKVTIWDFASSGSRSKRRGLKVIRQLNHADTPLNAVWVVKFSTQNNYLATGTGKNTGCLVRLWIPSDNYRKAIKLKHYHFFKTLRTNMFPSVKDLAFNSNEEYLVSVGGDKMRGSFIKIWSIRSHQLVKEFGEKVAEFTSIDFSADNSIFVTGSYDGLLTFWDITGAPLYSHLFSNRITKVLFSPDKVILALGFNDGRLELYDAEQLLINRGRGRKLLEKKIRAQRTKMNQRLEEEHKTHIQRLEAFFEQVNKSDFPLAQIAERMKTTVFKIERGITELINKGKLQGEFHKNPTDQTPIFSIKNSPASKKDSMPSSDIPKQQEEPSNDTTCFYCGMPIPNDSYICSGCGNNLLICIICEKSINFEVEAGACPFCEVKGHLIEMQNFIRETGKCPLCKAFITPEELLLVSNIAKKQF
ncbi:MAG: hypothetical protein GF308_08510 [Candidatus Heimdallarchaeota archaeon]|nr:hypothetical protein [Candidatus Heimdallarchaeota archaeon]